MECSRRLLHHFLIKSKEAMTSGCATFARVGLLRAPLSLRQMCLNANLSTFVSTLIKKTDGEQSLPCRHCERNEAISKELSHADTRLLRASPIAMTLSTEGGAVPAVRFAHRRPPHPSRNSPPSPLFVKKRRVIRKSFYSIAPPL